ncbi:MAG: DUF6122 family protein [Halioglobus sp.]
MLHLALHFLVPLAMAATFYRRRLATSFTLMMFGLLIDVDHLLADPIYAADRCSIHFHPLHTVGPIALYGLALLHPKTRIVGIGLCIHILLDTLDCRITGGIWPGFKLT